MGGREHCGRRRWLVRRSPRTPLAGLLTDNRAQRLKTRRPGISSGMKGTWADKNGESVEQPAGSTKGAGRRGYGVTLLALAAAWLAWSRRRHGRPQRIPSEDVLRDRDSTVPRSRVRAAVEASKAAVSAAAAAARR